MTLGGVIFAGGGTGGHIFPAIAIAEQLNGGPARRAGCTPVPSSEVEPCHRLPLGGVGASEREEHQPRKAEAGGTADFSPPTAFLCSTRDIDRRILEPRGLDFTPIPAAPFSLAPKALARFALGWNASVRACRTAIRARCDAWSIEPTACVLVATGGFVCAPAAHAARRLGCRVALVSLDAVPGKAARLLARKADAIFTTYPAFNLEPVGPIVRNEARAPAPPDECRRRLGLDPNLHTLVVSGASQGATSINAFVTALVRTHPEFFEGWQILHQAGPDRAPAVEAEYRALPVPSKVVGLIDEVGLLWGSATLAIARSGAGTVAEIWANGIPALFMPYPYHKDQHQRLNAVPLAEIGLCAILEDLIDPARNLAAHAAAIADHMRIAAQNAQRVPTPTPTNGAARIAHALQNM